MIRDHERVVLTADFPEHGLKADDVGVVVMVHDGGAGYEGEITGWADETRQPAFRLNGLSGGRVKLAFNLSCFSSAQLPQTLPVEIDLRKLAS